MTGGFFAKFYVFSAALQANLVGLTIIGVLNSAVGAYYYLRIIVVMYMREAREELPAIPVTPALGAALAISVAATLYLGLLPGRVSAIRVTVSGGAFTLGFNVCVLCSNGLPRLSLTQLCRTLKSVKSPVPRAFCAMQEMCGFCGSAIDNRARCVHHGFQSRIFWSLGGQS